MFTISSLKLKSRLILAPMAGITDLPYRMLCRKFGAELAFVEMINCRSLSHKSRRTREMLSTNAKDRPLGIQLLGSDEGFILRALEVLSKYKFDLIDFNAACPAKKIVRRLEGAALLKEPKKLQKLLKIIVNNSNKPVTVKIRSGWDKNSVNAKEVALYAQDAGVNGLFIHGRTRMQEYGGGVDYSIIRKVKKALDIPVIASGDLFSAKLIKKMFNETGCDAVSIARGSLGNPWIFKQAQNYLKKGILLDKPEKKIIVNTMLKHLDMSIGFHGEKIGVMLFRKFFCWYTNGFSNIRPLRESSSRAKTRNEMLKIINAC